VLTAPISNIDILPTLAEWTKTKLPDRTLDGESISQWLTVKDYSKAHRPIYYYNYVLEGVKDGDWKLRITKKDDQFFYEMYNLSWDPAERVNLFDEAKYASQKDHLLQLFKDYPAN
jgi:arylsulfatase A-like enzyme